MTEIEGEKKNSPVVALCMELVSRPSITPKDEGCQQLLATKLRDSGFHIENFI